MIVFVVLAICGFIVLTFSLLFGHDADHDGDHHFGDSHGASVFSTKVTALFVTGFGASGAIAAHYKWSALSSSMAGVLFGLLLAVLGGFFVKPFFSQQSGFLVEKSGVVGR